MEGFIKRKIYMTVTVFLSVICITMIIQERMIQTDWKITQTQKDLAQEVFRFHVLANSDRKEDQRLKMKVKETVIEFMKNSMGHAENADEVKKWAVLHKKDIEDISQNIIKKEGKEYTVKARVTTGYFPDKTYGDVRFPAGMYESLRVEIGKAQGRNWWCVLYPNLCFVDAAHAVVPEEGKQQLQSVLSEEEYEMVTATSKFKIKWYFLGDHK